MAKSESTSTDAAPTPGDGIDLEAEYKTLRDEILQLYREQAQLAFASALPLLLGAYLRLTPSPPPAISWWLLGCALLLLNGIANKIKGNYYRIFFIGSYLSVFHERRGSRLEDFAPGPAKPGWHTRWRRIDSDPFQYPQLRSVQGNCSNRADAYFIGAVALALAVLTIGATAPTLCDVLKVGLVAAKTSGLAILSSVSGFLISIAAMSLLSRTLYQLWGMQQHAVMYRKELELLVAAELRAPRAP